MNESEFKTRLINSLESIQKDLHVIASNTEAFDGISQTLTQIREDNKPFDMDKLYKSMK